MPTPGRSRLCAAGLVAALVLSAGCGTRRDRADIERAATGPLAAGQAAAPGAGPSDSGSTLAAGRAGPTPRTASGAAGGPVEAGRAPAGAGAVPAAGVSAPPGRPARGTPVRIGVVGTMSGIGGTQKGSTSAIQAWARDLDDRGGLNGHPVEVIVVDDGNDPARLRSAVQDLVEHQHVIAFVGLLGAFSLTQGVADYLQAQRVPVVGGDRLSLLWQSTPMFFPQGSAADALIWLHMVNTARLAGRGAGVGWVSCQEAQVCKDADRLWQTDAAQLGMHVLYRAQVSVAQPSFTSECLRAQQAGVKWFLLATDANSIRRIATSCEQQGYHPRYAVLQTSQEMAGLPALDGGYFGSSTFPWISSDSPATAEFARVMRRYAPDVELSAHVSSGWTAAKLFEKAAGALGPTPSSRDVLEGLWRIRDDTLGGLTSPLTFVRDKAAPPRYCYFPMELRAGAWTAPSGSSPLCQPPP